MHVLRGHLGEVTCCSVSSDLGLVGSSSSVSGVLLHSLRTGRLIKKLDVPEAHSICLSSQGIVLIWNEFEKRLFTFTVNGIPIATVAVSPLSARVSCIEISTDGQFAAMGTCSASTDNHDCSNALEDDYELDKPNSDEDVQESNETRISVDPPSICFLDLYKLEVNTEHSFLAFAMYCHLWFYLCKFLLFFGKYLCKFLSSYVYTAR
jgi:WD40 repeat protein